MTIINPRRETFWILFHFPSRLYQQSID